MSAVPNPLQASFLRGGTSKGIYLNRAHLPADPAEWDRIFLGIMGSPDPRYGRQLNGMGGGISSLSKICVVGPPSADSGAGQDVDVEYTFVQIGIRDEVIDTSGNCGNLSSMIGVFALDAGLCAPHALHDTAGAAQTGHARATVRAWNTNTRKRVDTTFPVVRDAAGRVSAVLDLPQATIAGVYGTASAIVLDFVAPAGAGTGKLLPSGRPIDSLAHGGRTVRASFIDATNPTVFIRGDDLHAALGMSETTKVDFTSAPVEDAIEQLRRSGAEAMGLDPEVQAQPKIAVLSAPESGDDEADIVVHAYSMGVLHKAVPMTVGLCLGVAAEVADLVPYAIAKPRDAKDGGERMLKIRHPGGVVVVGSRWKDGEVISAQVIRTGRRLMKGVVWW
ncbi:DUF453-domain-containing protein [Wolfiporia cocos MD-104 SS10]|uniref:DUF453-domain-containing protein n=1 Tax=Wolfiporia cocos (strain MD-104) TaxID=742152 RepID=A0A2H3JZC9_WOLCO|nr:DUF453-domain-containing protein [Wolfiporia cocos MD-104 SS10]